MKTHLKQRQDTIKSRRQKRKLARRARSRRQILRYASLLLLIGLVASCFVFLPWKIKDIDQDINVAGNLVTSNQQVRYTLQTYNNKPISETPIYKLDPKILEKKICSLETVNHAFVRRYLFPQPHINIEIMEEFPWASYCGAPDENAIAVVAQTGRYIPIAKFPLVVQPDLKLIGKKASHMSEKDIKEWATLVNYISDLTQQSVKYIDFRQENSIWVATDKLNLKLGEADITLTKRISRLASVLPTLPSMRGNVEFIDLSLDSNVPVKIGKGPNPAKDKTVKN